MTSWTIQPIWRQSPTFSAVLSLALASLRGFFLFLFCVAAGSDAFCSVVLYCRVLMSGGEPPTVYDRRWVTWDNGGSGGHDGDLKVYPQLRTYNYSSATSSFVYWPSGYPRERTPVLYTVVGRSSLNFTIPDSHTNKVDEIVSLFSSLTPAERSAVSSLTTTWEENGDYSIGLNNYNVGRYLDGAVSTFDTSGNRVLSYPDSTGYVPGYEPIGPDGSYQQVYYDTSSVSSSGFALRLTNLENLNSSALSYDASTGQYSFSQPDYSSVLSSIRQDLHNLYLDGFRSEVTVNPPEVTVNPEITVNPPEVTVNPEITVNPQVTVNPTVTVTPDVTVNVSPTLEVPSTLDVGLTDQGYQDVVDIIDESQLSQSVEQIANAFVSTTSVQDFDTSQYQYSQEEQSLIDVVNGWNTQIPVISNACNVAFNAALGSVPSIPASNLVPISGINIFGFNIVIDLRPYASMFAWFRAFVLMLEVVWFIDAIWRTCVNAFKV